MLGRACDTKWSCSISSEGELVEVEGGDSKQAPVDLQLAGAVP